MAQLSLHFVDPKNDNKLWWRLKLGGYIGLTNPMWKHYEIDLIIDIFTVWLIIVQGSVSLNVPCYSSTPIYEVIEFTDLLSVSFTGSIKDRLCMRKKEDA